MPVPLISAPFPFERNHIRSGPITRDGFGDYGVIFSARKNGSVNDFHPSDLTGAIIEVTELRQKGEPNRFFTILGGYYCERNPGGRPDEVNISHLFGVANDPALGFELSPGNHCLVDQWRMKDLSGNRATNMMDERDKGEDGWTFIVNYKPFRHQYPFSGKPMEVLRECPAITSFIVRNTGSTDTTVSAEAEATILHAPARKYIFDWGDGSPLEESDNPNASHQYSRPSGADASFTVTISVTGPDGCSSSQSSVFLVPGSCPVARLSESGVSYPSDQLAQADLKIDVAHQEGMQYVWLWGDQTDAELTSQPQYTHRYSRALEQASFKVNVTVKGPGTCETSVGATVTVDPRPCPVLLSIEAGEGQMNGGQFEVPFTLSTEGEKADEYIWDFGDGSEPVKSQKPEVTHGFTPGDGVETTRTVTVTSNGPGSSCSSSASTTVLIPGQCPIASPGLEILNVTDSQATVQANLNFTGPAPESWTIDWGDGSTPETVAQGPATHDYARPAGDHETLSVQITAGGPGSCTSNHTLTIAIPGACPVLTEVRTSWEGPQEGKYKLNAEVIGSGPVPDSYQWDWGDGTITTEGASASHLYAANPGEESAVTLTIQASGPDSCNASISKEEHIPSLPCPIIGKVHVTQLPLSGDIQEVKFEADFEGGTPGAFTWDWGDGSEPEATSGPSASHQYTARPGELSEYLVRLTTGGPGACKASTAVWVPIGRFCPIPDQIHLNTSPDENGSITAAIEVGVRGAAPAQIMVNWGDGSAEEEVVDRQATHTFDPKPGVNQQYQIVVTVSGPGSCGSYSETLEIHVPASCPVPGQIQQVQKSLTDNTVAYEFSLKPSIPADSYVWTFGDGATPVTTSDPVVTYEYPRWAGQSPVYDVKVELVGPGPCGAQTATTVTIPEPDICPIISRIDTYISDEKETTVSIGFIPVSIHGVPTQYQWDFGDGSPLLDTTDPEVIHEFVRSAANSVEVLVKGSGPGACESTQKVQVGIPQTSGCPVLDRLVLSGSQKGDDVYNVRAEAVISSGTPESYEWNWGDGSPITTSKGAVVNHEYQLADTEVNRTISVKAIGPGTCEDQQKASVLIPAGKGSLHPWCKWWPYLVAFVAALAGGSWLVCPAAAVDPAPSGWVPWVILVLILALGAVIWLWQRNGTRRNCPPGICGGLAVGWTMFLTMTGVAFFLNDCLPSWIGWGIGCFVLAGGLAGWWFARCARTSGVRTFFTYFAISVIAFAIVALLIAMPALACV